MLRMAACFFAPQTHQMGIQLICNIFMYVKVYCIHCISFVQKRVQEYQENVSRKRDNRMHFRSLATIAGIAELHNYATMHKHIFRSAEYHFSLPCDASNKYSSLST